MNDIRLKLFQNQLSQDITAILISESSGVLSGINKTCRLMESLGLKAYSNLVDADSINDGDEIIRVVGDPIQIAKAEELIIGSISKSSGIATAARQANLQAAFRCKIVSGGCKKMPFEIKEMIRQAVRDGGAGVRISEQPFTYLDKNYVRMLGGIMRATRVAVPLGRKVVVQIRGETAPVEEEAVMAAKAGAAMIMIDTGQRQDIIAVAEALRKQGLRSGVHIAFAGNISLDAVESLSRMDVDVLDIGYAILDAPCLPMHLDVIQIAGEGGL